MEIPVAPGSLLSKQRRGKNETCQRIFKRHDSLALFTNDFPLTTAQFGSHHQMICADNRHECCVFVNNCAHYSSRRGSMNSCVLAGFKQRDAGAPPQPGTPVVGAGAGREMLMRWTVKKESCKLKGGACWVVLKCIPKSKEFLEQAPPPK